MCDFYNFNDFKSGRVIAAIHRDCVPKLCHAEAKKSIFGVECSKVDILFECPTGKNDVGAIIMLTLKTNAPEAVIEAINKLKAHPCVVFSEPDLYLQPHRIPNDQYFRRLWGLEKINCPPAWDYVTGSSDIVVGVTDSGINHNHPDIFSNMWIAPEGDGVFGRNFENENNDSMDRTGHGTHVAGTVGAIGNNAIGITGVCWNVKLAALKIGGVVFNLAAAVRAIDYANRNAITVLNNSWGGKIYSASLKYAVDNYNGLFVASAGNSGFNNDISPVYPSSFGSPNIISVAASDQNDNLASFSNYGGVSVDVAAPGTDILSTSFDGSYSYMDGTSMAAPHVAGAAALLKAYRPNLTTLEIKSIILSSVDKKPQFAGKVSSGGTINISKMLEIVR